MSKTAFPMDWDQWRVMLTEWLADQTLIEHQAGGPRAPGQNPISDRIIGTYRVLLHHPPVWVELNDVTMPDFGKGSGDRYRYIGLVFVDHEGWWSGDVCGTFTEVEHAIRNARRPGQFNRHERRAQ